MNEDSEIKQDKSKTTPSSHRDFFAKLYGSLEEEYNKKRGLESKKSSFTETANQTRTTHDNVTHENDSQHDQIVSSNMVDEDSEDDDESRNCGQGDEITLSATTSPGSSPTKDEEISPPRVPPPTLKQFQRRFEVSTGNDTDILIIPIKSNKKFKSNSLF